MKDNIGEKDNVDEKDDVAALEKAKASIKEYFHQFREHTIGVINFTKKKEIKSCVKTKKVKVAEAKKEPEATFTNKTEKPDCSYPLKDGKEICEMPNSANNDNSKPVETTKESQSREFLDFEAYYNMFSYCRMSDSANKSDPLFSNPAAREREEQRLNDAIEEKRRINAEYLDFMFSNKHLFYTNAKEYDGKDNIVGDAALKKFEKMHMIASLKEKIYSDYDSALDKEIAFESDICAVLSDMLLSSRSKGFSYLKEIIIYCLEQGINVENTYALYKMIAKGFETNFKNVEKCIRSIICAATNSGAMERINEMLSLQLETKYPPSNREFIFGCIEFMPYLLMTRRNLIKSKTSQEKPTDKK